MPAAKIRKIAHWVTVCIGLVMAIVLAIGLVDGKGLSEFLVRIFGPGVPPTAIDTAAALVLVFLLTSLVFAGGFEEEEIKAAVMAAAKELVKSDQFASTLSDATTNVLRGKLVMGQRLINREAWRRTVRELAPKINNELLAVIHIHVAETDSQGIWLSGLKNLLEVGKEMLEKYPHFHRKLIFTADLAKVQSGEFFDVLIQAERDWSAMMPTASTFLVGNSPAGMNFTIVDTKHWCVFISSHGHVDRERGLLFEDDPDTAGLLVTLIQDRWVASGAALPPVRAKESWQRVHHAKGGHGAIG